MRRALAFLLVLVIGVQPAMVRAQQPGQAVPPLPPPAPSPLITQTLPAAKDQPNVEALGVSFDRIKQILGDKKPTDDKNGMKLNYFVEVVAEAPPIQLFTPADVAPIGPIPYAGITHADIVDRLTPIEFKGGQVPVSALAIMGIAKLIEWEAARIKRVKQEEERRKQDDEERARQQKLQDSSLIIKK